MSKNQQRETFGTLKTKVYIGEKSTNLHFGKNDKDKMFKFAIGVLKAIQYGDDLDIAIFINKKLRENKISQVTVTARV